MLRVSRQCIRKRCRPARPAHLQQAEGTLECEHECDETELAELDANVEADQRQWKLSVWQAGAGQGTGEAEAVQQPKRKRDHPRVADREARLAAPAANNLGPQEEDAQRDRSVQRNHRHFRVSERRDGER